MRSKTILFIALLLCVLNVNAQNTDGDGVWRKTIILSTLDGTTMEYLIDANTKIKIEKPILVVEAEGTVINVELDNMSNIQYGKKWVPIVVDKELITISRAKQVPYFSDKNLNFKSLADKGVKAYVATGYDKASGTIWLTRVYDVPKQTGILITGEPGDYEIDVVETSSSYYTNLFRGNLEAKTINEIEGDCTNYYLSNGTSGVGFYKVNGSQNMGANRAYLPLPSDIKVVGSAGSNETIKVSSAKQLPYYTDQSLDFSSMDHLKVYTATGYDNSTGTIWLTRTKQVPAHTGMLIMADADTYEIPTASLQQIYKNMFSGTLEGKTIYTEEDDCVNYYLSNGTNGVGFYKVTNENGVTLNPHRSYLRIPKSIKANSRGYEEWARNVDLSRIKLQDSGETMSLNILKGIGENNGTTEIFTDEAKPLRWDNETIYLEHLPANSLIEVYSAEGWLVMSHRCSGGSGQLSLNKLTNGAYVVKINQNSYKIIKR